MSTCSFCLDMTSKFADISVGAVEGMDGWNTVIVRTEKGVALMQMAKASGKLETDRLSTENLAHLKASARLKKKRALQNIVGKTGNRKIPPRNDIFLFYPL